MSMNPGVSQHAAERPGGLIRWSGLAAMAAGLIFAGIQPVHPPDVLASVTTGVWTVITAVKLAMCFLFMAGLTGLHIRQQAEAGWLGLLGLVLFGASWALQSGFVFAEVFILPPLAEAAPEFVASYLSVVNGHPGTANIGVIAPAYVVVGLLYLSGGMAFGIATFRAGIFPRRPAGLLALTALMTPGAALLPHAIQRMAAIPMGIALAWLGYALWSETRPSRGGSQNAE